MTIYNSIRVMNTVDMYDVQHELRDATVLTLSYPNFYII